MELIDERNEIKAQTKLTFGAINEEAKHHEESPYAKQSFIQAYVSEKIPEMNQLEFEDQEEGYSLFARTPSNSNSRIKTPNDDFK